MREIGASLIERTNGELLREGTRAQTRDLREDEPHPVTGLATTPQLHQSAGKCPILGNQESIEVIWHARIVRVVVGCLS